MNVTEVTLRYVRHDDDVDRYLRLPLLKGWIDKIGFDSHRGPQSGWAPPGTKPKHLAEYDWIIVVSRNPIASHRS